MVRRARPRRFRIPRGICALAARKILLVTAATLIASGMMLGDLNAAPSARGEIAVPIDRALGATRSVEEVLESHLADNCYLGTSYGTIAPGSFGDFSTIDSWDCRYPNGRPKPGVGGYMNCAGFVSSVLTECGADVSPIANFVAANGYRRGNDTNAFKWNLYVSEKGFAAGRFATKEQMLASGILKRGDIIYINPVDFTGSNDCHMGFFWGSRSDEDLFWHSAFHGDGLVAGAQPGNMISRITPKSPATYYLVIKTQHDVDVAFDKVSADASFTDGNSQYALAGAEYDIFCAENDAIAGHIVTDGNGHAKLSLSPGIRYYAVETKAPKGFKIDTKRWYFTASEGADVNMPEEPGRVLFKIVKLDATGKIQIGADLSGATYRLVDAKGRSQEKTTDVSGRLAFDAVPLGSITVTETKAPEGYRLDTKVHSYQISADDLSVEGEAVIEPKDDFAEIPLAFDLEIAKFKGGGDDAAQDDSSGHEQPAAGVVFEIISNASGKAIGSIATGADGFVDTASDPNLWFGQGERVVGIAGAIPYDRAGYRVQEVASTVPDGFDRVGEWSITPEQMLDGVKLRYILDDERITSSLKIVKTDAETNSPVPLAGFTFQILDEDGHVIHMVDPYPSPTELDAFTTDSSGSVTLPERLSSGRYRIREIASSAPYLIGDIEVEFEIPADFRKAAPIVVVEFPDSQAMGRAAITKTCAEEKSATDGGAGGSDFDNGCAKALAGAQFDVKAVHDVVGPDGRVRALQGEIVDHVTTDEDGLATTKPLYLGSGSAVYAFIETVAPAGHVLDDTPHEVTLTYKDARTPIVSAGTDVDDAPTRTVIEKTGSDGSALAGATFALWCADDEIDITPDAETGAIALLAPDATGIRLRASSEDDADPRADDASTFVELERDKQTGYWHAERLLPDDYEIISSGPAGGDDRGTDEDGAAETKAGSVQIMPGRVSYGSLESGSYRSLPVLLADNAQPDELTTDDSGRIFIGHLRAGSYRIAETAAPPGYLIDAEPRSFTVDDRGLTEGMPIWTIRISDDCTKLAISKRDITDEQELPGATLSILDENRDVVATWVSGGDPHRIDRLAPGSYTLIETIAPHTYDQTTEVPFKVEPTGEIQHVIMYDEPIAVSGGIDVRQEIARPTAAGSRPNGDGRNRATVNQRDDGRYACSFDFRSTSSTWVDEFTVECSLDAVSAGASELERLITPRARGDYDGKMNVWFKTDGHVDGNEAQAANASRSDGHVNPWLDDDSTSSTLGDDGRALDYTGWKLWAADVSTDRSTELKVSDLGLASGQRIVGVRFEYGRVDAGFTTRAGEWDRDDIKDPHDDLDWIGGDRGGDSHGSDRNELAGAVLHLRAGASYTEGVALNTSGRVDLYRNGGGDDLEDHDTDRVTQTPGTVAVPLPQTGAAPLAYVTCALSATAASAACLIGLWRHRTRSGGVGRAARRRRRAT
ncbi:Cna B domain protein [Coriobacterium glomerans PW2]|uniref:Cna B domain protein n=1 Tax=Coriobacterium glomerans (strain ATCC 49209 / DSM 20642 / JCM 10262 / PW2) TaxID=700015 RepID=F2N9D5_CORGP|nr:SpaA isopeptide-forming pilin-related protein [Coriobacterium glomerans]AEB07883.1 Cna B domain protein [Coriobacterium glomerans PW2]